MNNNNRGNNNNNNNRRRGRGNNNRPQGGGGGQQTNRIDSRARGNAPQLLEKYKKLAHDAHLNGDRVTEEYYLQFSDHYFRVIADQRQRQEDARQPRRDDRPQEYTEEFGADDDGYADYGHPTGNAVHSPERQERQERQERNQRPDREPRQDREPRAEREPRQEREPRADREQRQEREPRAEVADAPTPTQASAQAPAATDAVAEDGPEGERSIYEPVQNPFVREGRAPRGLKQRQPRRREADDADDNVEQPATEAATGSFDTSTLPPSISKAEKPKRAEKVAKVEDAAAPAQAPAAEAGQDEAAEEKPRRRRARKVAPPADEGSGALEEAVNG